MKQNRGYNILNLLVILIFTLSLWGCFGGMNPNESKSLLDNPEGEEMTGTPLALSGAVMIPQSAAAAVSASSSQALQVSAIQPSQFVTLVMGPSSNFLTLDFRSSIRGRLRADSFPSPSIRMTILIPPTPILSSSTFERSRVRGPMPMSSFRRYRSPLPTKG